MATADRILALKLIGDVSSIDKTMKRQQGRFRSFAGSIGSWTKAAGIGLAIEGVDMLSHAIGDAWDGFRSGEKVAAQLGTTWKNLDVKGAGLQATIDAISASTLKLGTSDDEAIMAFNRALQATGGKPKEALDRLRIAQDLVANQSAPNLNSAMKMIQQASKGSARVVDQFGLVSKTAAGRVQELGDKVKGAAKHAASLDPLGVASNAIGEGLETIVGALSKGDLDKAATGISAIADALFSFSGSVAPGITTALDKMTDGGWSRFSDWVSKTFQPVIEKLGAAVDDLGYVWTNLQVILQGFGPVVQPVLDLLSNVTEGGLGAILDTLSGILTTVGALLKGDFAGAFAAVGTAVSNVAKDIDTFFSGLPGKLLDWAVGVGAAATNVGTSIYNGILTGLAGIADAIVAPVRDGLNAIIRVWNDAGVFVPQIVLFDALGRKDTIGPFDFQLPDIPLLARGGVTTGPTLAMIGERGREAVIPLDRAGGIGGDTFHVTVNTGVGDPVAIGRAVVLAITAYERRSGKVWRTA